MKIKLASAWTILILTGCSGGGTDNAATAPAATPSGASAHEGMAGMAGMAGMSSMEPAPNDTEATRGYKRSMATMMNSMPAYTQDADIDFNKQMKVHHQAAIDMAEAQLAHGTDPASRALAQEIVAAQRREIAQIDAWLRQRGR